MPFKVSNLIDIQERLQETNALLAQLEGGLVSHPDLPSLLLELKSLRRREQKLRDEFLKATAEVGLEV